METLLKTPSTPKEKLNNYGSDIKQKQDIPKKQFKKLWSNKSYRYIAIFQTFYLMQMLTPTPFIVLYGAQYFADCLTKNGREAIPNCQPDYSTYNFYMTMFVSIEASLSFLTSGFMGKLSDSFGRKPFLIITVLAYMIPRTMMIFYVNFWVYWVLSLGQALYSGFIPIVSKGYIADIFPDKNMRMIAYAGIHSSTAIGAVLGILICIFFILIDIISYKLNT